MNNQHTGVFHRYKLNPILTAENWPYPINSVFNARATFLPDGITMLLCHAEDRRGLYHFCAARSAYGIDGWQIGTQRIEGNVMVEACVGGFNVTPVDKSRFDNAVMCSNWFLGHNNLSLSLYDLKIRSCRNGFMTGSINRNEGNESSFVWLFLLITLKKFFADEILTKPSYQKTN
jgi:hypothetical protein